MNSTSSVDYNLILLNAIPQLSQCKKASGVEGVAYFLDDNFVVKSYHAIKYWERFDKVFGLFCREMQSIADVYNYPKIYAWEKIPNIMYYTGKAENKYDYYILLSGQCYPLRHIDDIYDFGATLQQ